MQKQKTRKSTKNRLVFNTLDKINTLIELILKNFIDLKFNSQGRQLLDEKIKNRFFIIIGNHKYSKEFKNDGKFVKEFLHVVLREFKYEKDDLEEKRIRMEIQSIEENKTKTQYHETDKTIKKQPFYEHVNGWKNYIINQGLRCTSADIEKLVTAELYIFFKHLRQEMNNHKITMEATKPEMMDGEPVYKIDITQKMQKMIEFPTQGGNHRRKRHHSTRRKRHV